MPPLESGVRLEPDLSPDWSVAVYAMILAVAATLAFTLAPAVRTWRQDLLPWMKAGEQGVIQGRSRLANILVVAQLALCCLLLTSAGLAWRSISLMDTADLYFTKDHLLLAGINTAGRRRQQAAEHRTVGAHAPPPGRAAGSSRGLLRLERSAPRSDGHAGAHRGRRPTRVDRRQLRWAGLSCRAGRAGPGGPRDHRGRYGRRRRLRRHQPETGANLVAGPIAAGTNHLAR